MGTLLGAMERRIGEGFDLHRGMMRNLGVAVSEDEAAGCRQPLKRSLIACAGCGEPALCRAWLDQGHPGLPMFCRGREAFEALIAALADARASGPASTLPTEPVLDQDFFDVVPGDDTAGPSAEPPGTAGAHSQRG